MDRFPEEGDRLLQVVGLAEQARCICSDSGVLGSQRTCPLDLGDSFLTMACLIQNEGHSLTIESVIRLILSRPPCRLFGCFQIAFGVVALGQLM